VKIAIDFDGTVVEHKFPAVGKDVPHAVESLKKLVKHGHKLILYTMRSDDYLKAAVKWFAHHEIPLYGIQFDPEQASWTSSNKCNADLVIDDRNLGIPMTWPASGRPYVNWFHVETMLEERGAFR
jgi:hypothetical protein